MAKPKVKDDDGGGDTLEMKASVIKTVIRRIEEVFDEMASAKGSFMSRQGKFKDRINAIYDEGSRKGVPSKALRKAIQIRARTRKARETLEQCEADERAVVQTILELNDDPSDLPLFAAATRRSDGASAEAPALH
jgi:uncharacterized protein (UPF0335 family)